MHDTVIHEILSLFAASTQLSSRFKRLLLWPLAPPSGTLQLASQLSSACTLFLVLATGGSAAPSERMAGCAVRDAVRPDLKARIKSTSIILMS